MEKDFHYHLIYAVSKITGFEKAEIIASRFIISYLILKSKLR